MGGMNDDAEITPEEIVDVIAARWATAGITIGERLRFLAVQALRGYLALADATDE